MTCGHALIHYSKYCHHATRHSEHRPCPQDRVHGPLQCIDDTCAACHPPFKFSEINQRHDEFRDRKMAQMRQARSRQEVLMLERVLEESHMARAKELRDAGRVRWSGVVLWGPSGAAGSLAEECLQHRVPL
ncbi:hypothetical protein N431DRAFT_492807 [Stipitochalara longipes BDJ]|nr:hypothetical protein N431DRAFT_492807 [Stipitochalara longipes BDJ]